MGSCLCAWYESCEFCRPLFDTRTKVIDNKEYARTITVTREQLGLPPTPVPETVHIPQWEPANGMKPSRNVRVLVVYRGEVMEAVWCGYNAGWWRELLSRDDVRPSSVRPPYARLQMLEQDRVAAWRDMPEPPKGGV